MNNLVDQCKQADDDINIAVAAWKQICEEPLETSVSVAVVVAGLTVAVWLVAIFGIGG